MRARTMSVPPYESMSVTPQSRPGHSWRRAIGNTFLIVVLGATLVYTTTRAVGSLRGYLFPHVESSHGPTACGAYLGFNFCSTVGSSHVTGDPVGINSEYYLTSAVIYGGIALVLLIGLILLIWRNRTLRFWTWVH